LAFHPRWEPLLDTSIFPLRVHTTARMASVFCRSLVSSPESFLHKHFRYFPKFSFSHARISPPIIISLVLTRSPVIDRW
jgi:hypothetical protein